ncbi:serine/threonine-protein kinase [Streptomyces sp. NPDC058676]|uniref:serine/threonine-protein kinase n=1 Tax=unclassified Streptomyces TaxID=2593676 RepID=UPI0036582D88
MSVPLERVPRGYRVGAFEVTEVIAAGGWGTVYEGRFVGRDSASADGPGAARDGTGPGGAGHGGAAAASPGGVFAAEGRVVDAEDGADDTGGPDDTDRFGGEEGPNDLPGEGRVVALKFLPTAGLAPRQVRGLVETARREIELGRRARHPRLIRLLDSVVLSEPGDPALDGAVVLVMERAERSLRQLIDAEKDLTEGEKGRLLTGIFEGLAHLHGLGWVHGDLKPDNVLLMADGSVKLSDFGLAAELEGTHGTHGYIPPFGTPDYLPPERWKAPLGERGVQVRPSADIWALGIVIHQVFAGGASPFPGATPMARRAAVQEYATGRTPLRMDNAVPPFWRELIGDCLAPTHAARAEHTAASLLARIEAGGAGAVPGARVPVRRKALLATAVAAAVCGATAAAWSYAATGGDDRSSGARPDRTAPSDSAGPAGRVEVFNVEKQCRDRADTRDQQCSLGLAVDPLAAYTIDNVVTTRVWHGDVLSVDCRMPQGLPVMDEAGNRSTEWFRVHLPGAQSGTAWLPAVRTRDLPTVPECT